MFHMAIDGRWQVFKLQKSTSRKDFCRRATKNEILLRLINTLYSLNEATRLASIASGGGLPPDGLVPRLRSGLWAVYHKLPHVISPFVTQKADRDEAWRRENI